MSNYVLEEINSSIKVKNLLKGEAESISSAAKVLSKAINTNHTVYLMGNGGSAADAQHIAAELVGQFDHNIKRSGLPVIALTTNTSIITAISNDISFQKIFTRQLEPILTKGDVVIGISTSGKSKNVLDAIKVAKKKGAHTIGFTGKKPNPLVKITDLSIRVPSNCTQRIQECHILIGHILCGLIEANLTKHHKS